MKKLLLCIISFLFLSTNAQTSKNKESLTNSLLFEVSGNGLSRPSYIFGTYHLIGKDFWQKYPVLESCFNKVSAVAGEIVVGDELQMQQQLMPYMLLKDQTLDKLFSQDQFKEINSVFKKESGMNLSILNGLKPAAIQLTLLSFIAPKEISPGNPPLDGYIQNLARENKKEVIGLETLEEQAEIIFDIPEERQKEQLLKFVEQLEKNREEGNRLLKAYKEQNLAELEHLFKQSADFNDEEMNRMLFERNYKWSQKLPVIMKRGPVFIAVGAGHLVGEKGLLRILQNQGYEIKPLLLK
ncbi:TraB/GumN family protein [Rubrolithibacter danxiaensis]|uniref:TraB/GumN family protein n=1 Tax=Rubrolithibacter danxiaensis TaxID=3390805 RepID=UPI003BF7959F